MPRRRPGALRAERGTYEDRRPPAWAWQLPSVDRLPAAAAAAVHWAGPGRGDEVADLLTRYRAFLGRPGSPLFPAPSSCPACPGCARDDIAVVRDELADLHHTLPPVARTALGRVLHGLDAEFRRRTLPEPDPPADRWTDWRGRPLAWWHRRVYEGGG
ncbi:hypothetical protein [Streptomyces sp. NBC_01443]|uniref:hypothetical protein n=1 Tax=Streptomyces sp. NBC_01443 TaxID=2903868 RepID=UPI00225662ED|nr:hypothetical protein [Streptomyces sp. NBC_01443]MCX4631534.1 hypothetical protein [Streptomyces sp. NBC_01443]